MRKAVTSIDELTAGFPKEYTQFMTYNRKLKFEEKPDYQSIISMFRELFIKEGYEFDYIYDWIIKKQALK